MTQEQEGLKGGRHLRNLMLLCNPDAQCSVRATPPVLPGTSLMPPQMMLLEGLNWIGSRDEWTAKRAWPDFLSAEVIEWHIEGKGEPTAAQKLALRNLIPQAETIGTTLKEALFRYIKIARKKNPDWFEDCPAIRSAGQLAKLLELSSVTVLRQESDGEALIGLGFSCEWDPEHGFGVAVFRGHLVDAGPFECS